MQSRDAGPADIEALVRETLSGVAVSSFARGVGLSVHLDARLPVRVTGDPAAVTGYLRRGLVRAIEADRAGKIALGLWREPGPGGSPDRILLEVVRPPAGSLPATAQLAALWALPLGGARAEPRPHRRDQGVDSVLVALPLAPAPDAPPLAERWRPTFQGLYMLHAGDPLFDPARLVASLAAIGLEVGIARTSEAALALARERADAGKAVDLLLVDSHALGAAASDVARAFRADPRLAGALIALAGTAREDGPPAGEEGLFDAVRPASRPWRRLIEVFRELIEARGGPPPGAARARGPATSPAPAPAQPAGVPDLSGRRLLLAEDVETNRALLRALLAPTGAAVETVSGGEAALEIHAATPFDLIVMDLQMPGMGGIAAARRIRAMPGAPGRVPVVALTAHAGAADRQRALAAGMDAYLAKPVVISEFYDVLRGLLPARDGDG